MLVAKRGNKRANLTNQAGSVPSAAAGPSTAVNGAPVLKRAQLVPVQDTNMLAPSPTSRTQSISSAGQQYPASFPSPSEQPFDVSDSWSRHNDMGMDLDVPISSLDTSSTARGTKRKSMIDADEIKPSKPRTLGGDRPRDVVPVKEIGGSGPVARTTWGHGEGLNLPIPALMTLLTTEVDGGEDVLEARNAEDNGNLMFFMVRFAVDVSADWVWL